MSEISLILVLLNENKQNSEWHGKSTNKIWETHSFWGIFSIMKQFDALLAQTIDSTLGLRCTMFGYQYSEILRSLMCVYLCAWFCILVQSYGAAMKVRFTGWEYFLQSNYFSHHSANFGYMTDSLAIV